ncbi:bifunctional ADP-dependent NAD(P)H-hydrate dehydratase/NAD(P)H-hydrate epimerase [Terracidiphilus gabretensis]|uniref:bifunctional ADP-dependent NAD(P)H-hydrate dehydratase/NAD(P)H-hydrate epimerase n=1 Tax=Terracidiphilus gabretensis TaxID=1577687 RepID=UPI00071C017F|nr:bifunctional ADP-dependent NAD(P)H-hydrate dehydratase/NAD(P)H-hydrate epimerase [Terracidiphilus gabretensis]
MLVLSAAEMQACDRLSTDRFGISSIELMRNAAKAVADVALRVFPRARRVTVLCGKGNNGGDGAMAARLLADGGLQVTVLLLGSSAELKGDAATAWGELEAAANCKVFAIATAEELSLHGDAFDAELILDAVVGTGFQLPLRGLAVEALKRVKQSKAKVLAVDLPSGWPADETKAAVETDVFPADAVVTFTAPKPAHVFGQLTREWDQPVVVAPIGSPTEAMVSTLGLGWDGAAMELVQRPRAADANKGKFGHVLVVGGSFGAAGGKAGAAVMSSMAAMRVGAGLVTAAVPETALAVVSGYAPELMTWPLKANAEGQIAAENLAEDEALGALTKGITVAVIGPGMGQSADTMKFLNSFLSRTKMPVVIDADALNQLARQSDTVLTQIAKGRTVVITPHPGEMARLAGISTAEVQAKRLDVARGFAVKNGVIVVLKGARTLVAHPNGQVSVNTTGNPGMAKGGSGDVLAGMIAGMLAQYPDEPERAVEAAVYLHGLAADIAVRKSNEHTLLATDSFTHFSQAFRISNQDDSGYVWLQGRRMTGRRKR